MFTYILWQFLILETFVLGALCCECKLEHPQTQFCNSEFVLKVETHTQINEEIPLLVIVKVKKVFKGDAKKLHPLIMFKINTPCLSDIEEFMLRGKTYVIFGYIKDEELLTYSTMCYATLRFMPVKDITQRAFESDYYKDNCNCAIVCVWPYIGIGPNIWTAWYRKWFEFLDFWIQPKYRDVSLPEKDALTFHIGCTTEE